jgi:hypothetical protein
MGGATRHVQRGARMLLARQTKPRSKKNRTPNTESGTGIGIGPSLGTGAQLLKNVVDRPVLWKAQGCGDSAISAVTAVVELLVCGRVDKTHHQVSQTGGT